MISMRIGSGAAAALSLVLFGASIASAQPTRMFFSNIEAETLSRSAPDGTGVEVIQSTTIVHGIAINPIASRMYLSDAIAGTIILCALDGTACSTVIASAGFPGDVDIDLVNRHIYWAQFDDHTIHRANLDGTSPTTIVSSGLLTPFGLALDVAGGKIYWAAYSSGGQIGRANLDGSSVEDLSMGFTGGIRGVAVNSDAGHLYWSDSDLHEIWRSNLDGSSRAAIVRGLSGMSDPRGLELDIPRGHLYWVADGGVFRSGLDGAGATQLVTTTGTHSALALEVVVLPDGGVCATADECLSGRCVDGFCCETECTGFCMSCAGSETGMANGQCRSGLAGVATDPTCVDGNVCTDDFCGAGASCMFVDNTAACDDSDACTGPGMCAAGMCVPGPFVCDAGVDGGVRDAGPPVDAGGVDASAGDAAIASDSGARDASTMDAGPGTVDAGCGCRAAARDSGVPVWPLLGLLAWLARRRR